ncbi:hypothetical protein NP493_55g03003 [Ridgeia piscesae]|uniref:Uncharacterized protein n=1 Tax=Ridgeia piscesae TaxID=27915 RepID=A0AAD9PAG3_RIDPI|nr:hypothetical protein NP493_55g03003 [Ridgeia piscesae]
MLKVRAFVRSVVWSVHATRSAITALNVTASATSLVAVRASAKHDILQTSYNKPTVTPSCRMTRAASHQLY